MEWFLANVCTHDWNVQQDGGRSLTEATDILIPQFPKYEKEIRAFYGRWTEMFGETIPGMVAFQQHLIHQTDYRVVALTNWSGETMPEAKKLFPFFNDFEEMLVSGDENMLKPNREIYERLCDKFSIEPSKAFFMDDNEANVIAAREFGLNAVQFKDIASLKKEMKEYGIRV